MKDTPHLEIYNETNSQIPNLRILDLKNEVLGKDFSLSISLLLPKNSKKINFKQRRQKYVPNTLSFLYTDSSGEVIMTPEVIESERQDFKHTYKQHFLFLLVHSILHLKGHLHGEEMEKAEQKYFKKYKNS
jgi:rRNA maturation RNase YbeY